MPIETPTLHNTLYICNKSIGQSNVYLYFISTHDIYINHICILYIQIFCYITLNICYCLLYTTHSHNDCVLWFLGIILSYRKKLQLCSSYTQKLKKIIQPNISKYHNFGRINFVLDFSICRLQLDFTAFGFQLDWCYYFF